MAYTCAVKGKVASICEGSGTVAYRFGALGHPELEVASDGADGKAHLSTIRGGGSGSQTSLRLSNDGYDYIVYSAVLGDLTEHPGERSSGVVVMKGEREVSRIGCPESGPHQRLSVVTSVEQDEDERVQGWF